MDFSDTYKTVSKFTYMHLNTAHEHTGTVISTLDDDLETFLIDFTKTDEDFVLFIMGDHGMRYGNWNKWISGKNEHRLPGLFVVTNHNTLKNMPNCHDILSHNSNRLISKLDFHTTLQHLGNYPDMGSNTREIKSKTSTKFKSYNLFTEKIPNNRTCADSGIPQF